MWRWHVFFLPITCTLIWIIRAGKLGQPLAQLHIHKGPNSIKRDSTNYATSSVYSTFQMYFKLVWLIQLKVNQRPSPFLPQMVVHCALNFKTTNNYDYSYYLLFQNLKHTNCGLRGKSNWPIWNSCLDIYFFFTFNCIINCS